MPDQEEPKMPTHTPTTDLGLIDLPELVYESTRPVDWLIEDIYPAGEVVLMSGASHSGKTYVLLDQGLAVAYGRPWLGRFAVPKARPVLYIPSEGRRGISKRVRAAIEHHYPFDDFGPFYLYPHPLNLAEAVSNGGTITGDGRRLREAIREATKEHGETPFVIVDVFRDFAAGIDENSAAFGDALGVFRDTAHATGATLIVAHHLGKDPKKGSRGHSSIKDKTDIEVIVSASPMRDKVTESKLTRTVVSLTNLPPDGKNRNEEPFGVIELELRQPEALIAPVVIGEWMKANPRNSNPAELEVLAAIEKTQTDSNQLQPPGYQEVADALGITATAATKRVKAVVAKGFVAIDKASKRHTIALTDKGIAENSNPPPTPSDTPAKTPTNPWHPLGGQRVVDGPMNRVEEVIELRKVEEAADADHDHNHNPDAVVEGPVEPGSMPDNIAELLGLGGNR